jgi:telomerase Cajal body protein 1
MEQILKAPNLVASTSDTYCCSIADSKIRESKLQGVQSLGEDVTPSGAANDEELETNYFKNAQW